MRILKATVMGSFSVVALLSGCASSPAIRLPDAPEALRPPAGQVLALEALATGVQIYECSASQDQPARFEWVFKAPEAELFDRTGRRVGKHYAGPTWESTDGRAVVGEVRARAGGPDPSAIPWLLLSAKSNAGAGVFSQIKSIQYALRFQESATRLIAPSGQCQAYLPYGQEGVLVQAVNVEEATRLLATRYAPERHQEFRVE